MVKAPDLRPGPQGWGRGFEPHTWQKFIQILKRHPVSLEISVVPRNTILVTSYLLLYEVPILLNIVSVYRQKYFATN